MYTPGFASPEQLNGREGLGPWSDIYSVGASLYACLAGSAPMRADQRVRKDELIPAEKQFAGRYNRQLLQTIDMCLHLDHMKRPQSVYALQKALAKALRRRSGTRIVVYRLVEPPAHIHRTPMKFTIFQESRVGRRRTNQDRVAYCYSREALLMILADGMGGHLHGEVAAQIAVQFVTQSFQREAKPSLPDVVLFLPRALSSAHHAILDYAFDKNLPDAPRTTVVACIVQDSQAYWAHAGDSRLYLLRRGGVAAQTRDHSRVQMMMDQGLLDAEGAAKHPSRNRIYSCLGGATRRRSSSPNAPRCIAATSSRCARTACGARSRPRC